MTNQRHGCRKSREQYMPGYVPSPDEGEWGLTEDAAVKIVEKKKN